MEIANLKEIKAELKHYSPEELYEIILHFSRFKKENKELLNYLLFERENEANYIQKVKNEIDNEFENLQKLSFYYKKKLLRKIHRNTKKYIRYSKRKDTEAELLIYYCSKLCLLSNSAKKTKAIENIYNKQIEIALKAVDKLHEDLQYDLKREIEKLSY